MRDAPIPDVLPASLGLIAARGDDQRHVSQGRHTTRGEAHARVNDALPAHAHMQLLALDVDHHAGGAYRRALRRAPTN
jgi:hypothetical protein